MSDDAPTQDEVIATLYATGLRRYVAYGVIFALGAMLVLLAFARPPAFGWQIFLIVLGGGALVVAEKLRRATTLGLELTERELRDTSGMVLARMEDISSVDRGAFAFKPSNGFILRLKAAPGRAWAPGLWWRYSTRVGVGGVTPMGPAKYMAEQIALILAANEKG